MKKKGSDVLKYTERIRRLQEIMAARGWDGVFVMQSSDMQYLTGVRRPLHNPTDDNKHGDEIYGALITQDKGPVFLVPRMGASRYVEDQIKHFPWAGQLVVIQDSDDPGFILQELLKEMGKLRVVGISGRSWARTMFRFQDTDPTIQLEDASGEIAAMRAIKDSQEIAVMQEAGMMTDAVFAAVLRQMRLGMTEYDLVREVAHQVILQGGAGLSFHTGIVIRGKGKPRRFMNGGTIPNTPLQPGTVVSFDFGLVHEGYASDFGRTVFCGDPPTEWVKYHEYVMEAQSQAIAAMVSGQITAAELNQIGRKVIEDAGLGKFFTHRLGHGIGIDVHEAPFLYELDHTVLKEGMCFTIEPSIVIPDEAGIRVEDVVMVTEHGGKAFSQYSKELLVI